MVKTGLVPATKAGKRQVLLAPMKALTGATVAAMLNGGIAYDAKMAPMGAKGATAKAMPISGIAEYVAPALMKTRQGATVKAVPISGTAEFVARPDEDLQRRHGQV